MGLEGVVALVEIIALPRVFADFLVVVVVRIVLVIIRVIIVIVVVVIVIVRVLIRPV